MSASKTVGRAFVNRFIDKYPDFKVEELDLYKEHIPRLEYEYFESRNCVVNEEAAPMWSLSFPAPLKEYIDCIVQVHKTIAFPEKGEKPEGLLKDKPRTVVYIQSSGGNIAWR